MSEIKFTTRRALGPQLTGDILIAEVTHAIKGMEHEAYELGLDIEWASVVLSVDESEWQPRSIMDKYERRDLQVEVLATKKEEK